MKNNKKLTYNLVDAISVDKPRKKDIIFFIIPIIIYISILTAYNRGYITNLIPRETIYLLFIGLNFFIAMYSATIGYKYVGKYISKVNGKVIDMIPVCLFILCTRGIGQQIGVVLTKVSDPQNLSNMSNTFEKFITQDIIEYMFVGIGEELLCFYILMVLISIIPSKYKFIISIIITSFIFGVLHAGWGIDTILPIALGHIGSIYSYIRWKSILPAMITHGIGDMIAVLSLIPGMAWVGEIIIIILMVILIIFVILGRRINIFQ